MANKGQNIIQTIFGVRIPPRKKVQHKNCLTLRFVITGTIPSKKNNYTAERNWQKLNKLLVPGAILTPDLISQIKDVKPYVRKADRYKDWEEEVTPLLVDQASYWHMVYAKYGLSYPITRCSLSYYHYWADNRGRDNSNKHEGFDDLFVSCGLISSDAHQCLYKSDQEAHNYHGEINDHITVITLVAYDWVRIKD